MLIPLLQNNQQRAGESATSFSSDTTDGADVLAASISPVIGFSSATTDGADGLSAQVSNLDSSVNFSAAMADGADILSSLVSTGENTRAGFEMGARIVSVKPLLQRIKEAKAERIKPLKKKARHRAAVVEIEAANLVLSNPTNEGAFRALMDQWLAQKPELPAQPTLDVYHLFMAQVALRLQAIEREQQDEEDTLIALLLS